MDLLFILIPVGLIVLSCLGIVYVISRKISYTKKLTPESHEFGATIFHDYFPELMATLGKIRFEEYLALTARELEKLIRKIRLLFSKIDTVSNSLISELRAMNQRRQEAIAQEPVVAEEKTPELEPLDTHIDVHPKKNEDIAALKNQEQQLIIEIAHHPKDAKLYAALGEIYIQMKNFPDAKESLEAATELDAQNQALRDRLAFVQRKLQQNTISS